MRSDIYVCSQCGESLLDAETVDTDSGVGRGCTSCGGGCDPAQFQCWDCGSYGIEPHSRKWDVDSEDWVPLCEACGKEEISGSAVKKARCLKCNRILDVMMLLNSGCIMCIFDDINGMIKQINETTREVLR
jgi:DNA-directed RNA polymerase subunit RPC12/RpoP